MVDDVPVIVAEPGDAQHHRGNRIGPGHRLAWSPIGRAQSLAQFPVPRVTGPGRVQRDLAGDIPFLPSQAAHRVDESLLNDSAYPLVERILTSRFKAFDRAKHLGEGLLEDILGVQFAREINADFPTCEPENPVMVKEQQLFDGFVREWPSRCRGATQDPDPSGVGPVLV